jgi:anti-sigma regulatory factor (Ser/Thr protein kinase)
MITTTALYSAVFHGVPDQIARVRAGVRDYLDGCLVPDDAADDAVLIASELATNAIRHTHSRGAFLIVRCEVFPSYIWVECEDLGGPWHPRQQDGRPHGLDIVKALAGDGWGTEVTSDGYRVVWARVDFHAS